jgi:hypothetical protein
MNGVGLTEDLLNSIKSPHIAVASHSVKVLLLLPISQLMAGLDKLRISEILVHCQEPEI